LRPFLSPFGLIEDRKNGGGFMLILNSILESGLFFIDAELFVE
jgi:hypothetical protein